VENPETVKQRNQRYFITGFIVLLPALLTIYLCCCCSPGAGSSSAS